MELPARHAISRAILFLNLADRCSCSDKDEHEAFMEAAIVFCRTAIHRLQNRYGSSKSWKTWFRQLLENASVQFIRKERDFILKEAPPKVGQVIYAGENPSLAKFCYYYKLGEPAVDTVRSHVVEIRRIVLDAEKRFGGGEDVRA